MHRFEWDHLISEKRIPDTHRTGSLSSLRSEVESDYYRIINSASFRRLQDKTQVFPLDRSDFVRTRLTHSLEVSAVAKFIGKQVCTGIMDQGLEKNDVPTHDIVETLACASLLHDIGRAAQYREGVDHAEAGAAFAERILPEAGFTPEERKLIKGAISGHRQAASRETSDALGDILSWADKQSRMCWRCPAADDCYWPEDKKNRTILY